MRQNTPAFHRGYDDYCNGLDIEDNPYYNNSTFTSQSVDWEDGWLLAEQDDDEENGF